MKLYTIKEVCEIFKISETTFFNWAKKGIIRTIKISDNCTRVSQEELDRLIKGE